jgi:tetratricopeptide (TPR) repeat protein
VTFAVPDASKQLRHLPFIEELAATKEPESSALAACAGLLVLRLVDAWMENPALVAVPDGRAARAARSAVERISTGSETRTILLTVLDAMMDTRAGDSRAVSERLMAYGHALDLDAQWDLATDVYETILDFVHADQDCETAVNALLRRAACLRELGKFDDSAVCCDIAIEHAKRYGDKRGELRAQIGRAKIVYSRGDLPLADAMLADTVRAADEHALTDIRWRANQDRGELAFLRGEYEVALRFAHAAWQESGTAIERDRLLCDIAGMFYMLGMRSTVRDVYLILAATAREQSQRWVSTINLMEIAAEDGQRLHFERYQQQLAGAALPPHLRAEFELHAGRGYRLFNEPALAREWLERALGSAAAYSLNRLVFTVEEAIVASTQPQSKRTPMPPAAVNVLGAVGHIAEQLRMLRERSVLVSE